MSKLDERTKMHFHNTGYLSGYKSACADAAEELVAQAQEEHVDLSKMAEVKRVAKIIEEMYVIRDEE